ncbi:hypothetical protein PMIN06_000754 [Paraphaeosphaeria minitans]
MLCAANSPLHTLLLRILASATARPTDATSIYRSPETSLCRTEPSFAWATTNARLSPPCARYFPLLKFCHGWAPPRSFPFVTTIDAGSVSQSIFLSTSYRFTEKVKEATSGYTGQAQALAGFIRPMLVSHSSCCPPAPHVLTR